MIEEQLHLIGDLERIISKVAVGRVSPREVVALKVALQAIEPIKAACMDADNASLNHIGEQLNICQSIRDRIDREIDNDPPLLINKGGVIKSGVSAELDELRRIAYSGKDYLLQIQQRESELTEIPSLKIGYNNVSATTSRCATRIRTRCRQSGYASRPLPMPSAILPRN